MVGKRAADALIMATCALGMLVLNACQSTGPVGPTLAPQPTYSLTPEPSVVTVGPPTHAPTLPPTWTPHPTQTRRPVTPVPRLPTDNPATQTAQAPVNVITDSSGAMLLNITEAQLNAALKGKFDTEPLAKYAEAPRVTLSDGALILTLHIVPQNAPTDSSPQTITLVASLAVVGGALELQPTDLSPSDVGVTPRQVKLAHVLLLKTLSDMARDAAGQPQALSYNYASISPDKVSLTIVNSDQSTGQ